MFRRPLITVAILGAISAACSSTTLAPERTEGSPRSTPESATESASGERIVVSRAYPTGDEDTSVILLRRESPGQVALNQPFESIIAVKNLTDQPVEGVVVRDRLSPNYQLRESRPEWSETNEQYVLWSLGTLDPGATRTITIDGLATDTGTIGHCAEVEWNRELCIHAEVVQPRLELVTQAPRERMRCDDIVLGYRIANPGDGIAKGVVIRQELPEGLTSRENGGEIRIEVGDLAPGAVQEYSATVRAEQVGQFETQALASSTNGLEAEGAPTTLTIVEPRLEIALEAREQDYAGVTAPFGISLTNTGDGPAHDTVLEFTLPAGAESIDATGNAQPVDGKLSWQVGTLPPGETFRAQTQLRALDKGTLQSRVVATAYCADEVSAAARTEITGLAALLLEVIDTADPILVGNTEVYRIRVTNQGTETATGIQVQARLEDGFDYQTSDGPTRASVQGGTVTFASLPTLAPGAEATWTVSGRARVSGEVLFHVRMTSEQLEREVEETESTQLYE